MNACHFHLLAKFGDDDVRGPVGRAKKHASFLLSQMGLPGTVWAKRCRVTPIRDRAHQVNVFHYVEDHMEEGGWIWTYRTGLHWRQGTAGFDAKA